MPSPATAASSCPASGRCSVPLRTHSAAAMKNGTENTMRSASRVTGSVTQAYASLMKIGRSEKKTTPPTAIRSPATDHPRLPSPRLPFCSPIGITADCTRDRAVSFGPITRAGAADKAFQDAVTGTHHLGRFSWDTASGTQSSLVEEKANPLLALKVRDFRLYWLA